MRSGWFVGVFWAVTAARLPRILTGFPFAERTLFSFLAIGQRRCGIQDLTGKDGATQVAAGFPFGSRSELARLDYTRS
jgi:hypothetical protein